MAGAGFKTFNTGDVLTAADVNTYLMQQTVMVFADSAARTTALGANVSEGMLSYLKDTNQVEVYNGSSWVASDDPNAIQNTIVDAKGDLISATAADTPARLAVGADGTYLQADSTTATGLKWGTVSGGGMTLISTTSLSGTSVTLSSIPQTYKKLVVYISGATNTTNNSLILSLQVNGNTNSEYQYVTMAGADSTLNQSAANYTAIRLQGQNVNYSSMLNNVTIEIDNYTYTQQKAIKYYGTGSISGTPADDAEYYLGVAGLAINAAAANAALTSLTIFDSYNSSNFNGGTIYLYGVN